MFCPRGNHLLQRELVTRLCCVWLKKFEANYEGRRKSQSCTYKLCLFLNRCCHVSCNALIFVFVFLNWKISNLYNSVWHCTGMYVGLLTSKMMFVALGKARPWLKIKNWLLASHASISSFVLAGSSLSSSALSSSSIGFVSIPTTVGICSISAFLLWCQCSSRQISEGSW